MAEYIDRNKLIERLHNAEENYKTDHDYEVDDDPFSDGILSAMFSVNQIIGTEPTADVVERAEYDKLKSQLDYEHEHGIEAANNLLDVLGKLDFQRQENKKLRTKIDNARIQIEKLSGQTCYCSDGIIDEVLDILEEI